jgi:predicted nucleotidyltransferase
MTKDPTDQAIDLMVQRLVDRYNPDQIILFGSRARGAAGPDSDVDLLVVLPVSGSKRQKQVEMRVLLHDIRLPKDIIVATPEEVARQQNLVGTIIRPALQEGKILYARQ